VGLIEVDGPHHKGRAGADTTRDRHWKNSGVVHIERILVEETAQDRDLDQVVRAFLKRMAR
jgi:very-short-patch-repair endonuclease